MKKAINLEKYKDNTIPEWIVRMIHGPRGMTTMEEYEHVVWKVDIRVAAADFIVRCLGNNTDKDTDKVLDAIIARRNQVKEEKSKKVQK